MAESSAQNASNAITNGNEADEDEDGDEILVIGVREKNSSFAENRLSIDPGGAWLQAYQAPTGGLSDAVPWFLRNLLDLPTTITIGEEF